MFFPLQSYHSHKALKCLQTQTQPTWAVSVSGSKEAGPEPRSQLPSALRCWCLLAVGSRRCFSSTQPHCLCSPRKGCLGLVSSGWSFETQRRYWIESKLQLYLTLYCPVPTDYLFFPPSMAFFIASSSQIHSINLSHLFPLLCSLY